MSRYHLIKDSFWRNQIKTKLFFQDTITLYEAVVKFSKEILAMNKALYLSKKRTTSIYSNGMKWIVPDYLSLEDRPIKNPDSKVKKNELIKYGDPDDDMAKSKHQQDFISPLNIHPFSRSISTVSTLAHSIFRAYGLPNNTTVPILHDGGTPEIVSRTSKQELECMTYLKQTDYPDLQYGLGQVQKRFILPNGHRAYVDGYSTSKKCVIEFNGCFIHVSHWLKVPVSYFFGVCKTHSINF